MTELEFLRFKWPKKMLSYSFKKRKHYEHNVIVTSLNDPEIGFVFNFPSEAKARAFKKAGGEALNAASMEYERKEVPDMEDGFTK